MYILGSKVTIGGVRYEGIHAVKIKRSIYDLSATASVQVPVTAVLRRSGEAPALIETAKAIKVGDPVEIQLAYNGQYYVEFRGYVKMLNYATPLEIVCEDAFYLTRSSKVTLQGKTTLAKVLDACGLTVGYCTTLTLSAFQADDRPVAWVLAKLKSDYGLSVWFDFDGRVYASEPFKIQSDTVRYELRRNVIKDDDLKYHRADDVHLSIKAVCIYRNGTKVEAKIGAKEGTQKTLYFYDVEDKNELAALADAELKRYSYDGYDGKITTFLQPYAAPGMIAQISDPIYNERGGNYYIDGVETTYGADGARRTVSIGIKL